MHSYNYLSDKLNEWFALISNLSIEFIMGQVIGTYKYLAANILGETDYVSVYIGVIV